jgi:hypothetical protein
MRLFKTEDVIRDVRRHAGCWARAREPSYGKGVAKVIDRQLGSARDWAREWSQLRRTAAGLYLSKIGLLKWQTGQKKTGIRKRKVRGEAQKGKLRRIMRVSKPIVRTT